MKVVRLTESQFNRLIESDGAAPSYDNGDVKEFGDSSKISVTNTVHDTDGNPQYGKPFDTDKVAKQLTPQNWFADGRTKGNFSLNY